MAQYPARVQIVRLYGERTVQHGVEQRDDVARQFQGVGDQDGIFIDAQQALGEAGFAVAGGSVEEQRFLRDQRGTELVQQMFREDQVVEGLP